jgi:hypothetical protein
LEGLGIVHATAHPIIDARQQAKKGPESAIVAVTVTLHLITFSVALHLFVSHSLQPAYPGKESLPSNGCSTMIK